MFYVPQKLANAYITFSRFFMRYNVIDEIAIPTIHYGIAHKSQIDYVKGSSLWDTSRNDAAKFYDRSILFLHPFKLVPNMAVKKSHDFYCNNYLVYLFSKLSDLSRTKVTEARA